ncbi:MAG: ABC transporter ATP-binding protein [Defluviitaleaceae bacterium]|nr:ABC transporter ATP-binding protein [Defluviitaleaceae bacterium]MCL2263216.1 ABC transporter ATP-binding protein [Defluviitaleaceae bacterium]
MLKVEDMNVYYGNIHAIKGVSFHVNEGEIVTLIGANGAGKSTILKTISGLMSSKTGSITFNGETISKVAPHNIVRRGLAHSPEGRRIFLQMSVRENLEMGNYTQSAKTMRERMEQVYDHFPRLKERRRQVAGTLSGGEQQMLAIGRALMSRPKLLMLDEPSMGLAPLLVVEIFKIVRECNDAGVTVLLVEQNANMALSISDRAYVLETGHIALEGSAEELISNDEVKKAYLGA